MIYRYACIINNNKLKHFEMIIPLAEHFNIVKELIIIYK